MPRVCTICHHPERAAIEAAIVAGTANRPIASQFGVGYKSVERHAALHIAQAITASKQAKDEAQSLDVVKQLKEINAVTLAILHEAKADKKSHGLALQAIDRVQKQLELQAKLLGDIDAAVVSIWLSPEWQTLRTTIVATLAPFPDARIAVAAALVGLEANRDRLN